MSFTRAGRIFEAMLFAVGAYYSFVENRSMLNTTLGRLFSGGSLILHDLWQWREFMGASDWAWQWSSVPTPLESPRAASLDAAVSLRMPSLLPFAAGSAGTSHNASSYSPTSSGDFRQLHALIDALRNSSHRLQCQRRQGQTFMYFDSGANDGLLPDEALGPIPMTGTKVNGRRRKRSTGAGLGDGSMVEAVEVEVGDWLLRTAITKDDSTRVGDSASIDMSLRSPSSSFPPAAETTLYCVEELALDWSRTGPTYQSVARNAGAWANRGGGSSLSWTSPQPLDELSSALLPFVESCLPFIATTAPDGDAYATTSSTGKADSAPAASDLHGASTRHPSRDSDDAAGHDDRSGGLSRPPLWQPPTVNVWMHSAGAVTPTHYDTWHNVLVQVAGRKRVTLLPPSAHPCVYLFPSLHPRARKSQVPAYARGLLPCKSCSGSSPPTGDSSQRNGANNGAQAGSVRQECGHNDDDGHSNDCLHNRRGPSLAPHFSAFLQNGTWWDPNQTPAPLEEQFPKFVRYLRTGTCDLPTDVVVRGPCQNNSAHQHRSAKSTTSSSSSSLVTRGRQRPWIVVLEPGDALYIPPLWLHSVETLDASISVNAFTPSIEDNEASRALYQVPLPFEPRWPLRMRARATVKYLSFLASELNLNFSVLVRELLASRYRMDRNLGIDEGATSNIDVDDHGDDSDAERSCLGSGGDGCSSEECANEQEGLGEVGIDASATLEGDRRRRRSSGSAPSGLSSNSSTCDSNSASVNDEEVESFEKQPEDEEALDDSGELDDRNSSESARLREWLPWCREPAADDTLKRTKTRAFVAAARAHTNVLSRLKGSALVQTTFEDLMELTIASAFGPKAVPLFLCACFSPAPTRAVLLGPQPLDLSTCVAQWDYYN